MLADDTFVTMSFGRVCLDFWKLPVEVGNKNENRTVFNRYPFSSCAQREPTIYALADAPQALADLAGRKVAGKVALVP